MFLNRKLHILYRRYVRKGVRPYVIKFFKYQTNMQRMYHKILTPIKENLDEYLELTRVQGEFPQTRHTSPITRATKDPKFDRRE